MAGSLIAGITAIVSTVSAAGAAVATGIAAGAADIVGTGALATAIGGIGEGALFGAGLGAIGGAITGEGAGKGALGGALTGGFIGAAPALAGFAGISDATAGGLLGAAGGALAGKATGNSPLYGAIGGAASGYLTGSLESQAPASSAGSSTGSSASAGSGVGGPNASAGALAAPSSAATPGASSGLLGQGGAGYGETTSYAGDGGGAAAGANGISSTGIPVGGGPSTASTSIGSATTGSSPFSDAGTIGTANTGTTPLSNQLSSALSGETASPTGLVSATPQAASALQSAGNFTSPGVAISGGGTAAASAGSGGLGGLFSAKTLLGAAPLALDALKGNQKYPQQTALQNQANQLASQGQQLQGYLTSGTLPPGAQDALNQAAAAAQASVRSRFANMGMSGSSAEAQDLANVQQQVAVQGNQLALSLLQQGVSETQLSSQLYSGLLNLSISQDNALSGAIGNFAAAMVSPVQPPQQQVA